MPVRDLIASIREVPGLKLMPIERGVSKREEVDCLPVEIQLADGRTYLSCTTKEGIRLAAYLHGVVDSYKDRSFLDRTMEINVEFFKDVHADLTALIIYPIFDVKLVLELAGHGYLLPTGITRFTVSPRALHLNYPLHELSSAKPIDYKQAYLTKWVQERIKHKNVRYYQEATFLYDE
jgi:hypothetical protein